MTTYTKHFILVLACVLLIIPTVSHAEVLTQQQKVQNISQQLTDLQSLLVAQAAISTANFDLSPGGTIHGATTTISNGLLTISLPRFLHTNPDTAIPAIAQAPITKLAQLTLEFDPCVAASPTVCVTQPSSSYPIMTSILSTGQQTGYLQYLIALNTLSSTTANFTIVDTTFLKDIQNQLNTMTAEVHSLLN